MADLRKVVVEIQLKGNEKNVENKTTENDNDEAIERTQGDLIKGILAHEGLKVAKQTLSRVVDSTVGNYLSMTENYIGEQIYQNAKTGISKVTSVISSVGGGLALGGGFTPAGAVGAVVGLVSWGVGEVFSIRERNIQINQSLNASAFQREFMGTRYGLINEGRGTEN